MALLECIAFFAHEGFNKKCKVVYALKITAHIVQGSIYKKYIPTFDHTNDKECFTISISLLNHDKNYVFVFQELMYVSNIKKRRYARSH